MPLLFAFSLPPRLGEAETRTATGSQSMHSGPRRRVAPDFTYLSSLIARHLSPLPIRCMTVGGEENSGQGRRNTGNKSAAGAI